MVGLTLSSSHGVGAGEAELQSTPTKYVAFADSSLLTLSVTPLPVQLPPNGPGPERSTEEVGWGAAVRGGCVGAGVLVGVEAADAVGVLVDAAAVTPVVELAPHADRSPIASGNAASAPRRVVVAMVPPSMARRESREYGALRTTRTLLSDLGSVGVVCAVVVADVDDVVELRLVMSGVLGDRGADRDELRGSGRHRRRLPDHGHLDDPRVLHL